MKAVAFRFPEELVERAKVAALRADKSFTAYVREAIEARLGAPSILDQQMSALRPTGDVSREACAHPFRDGMGRCRVCQMAL